MQKELRLAIKLPKSANFTSKIVVEPKHTTLCCTSQQASNIARSKTSKNEQRIGKQTNDSMGQNSIGQRTQVNKQSREVSFAKTHLLYVLPLENLTLNSTTRKLINVQKSISLVQIPLAADNKKSIQRSILKTVSHYSSQTLKWSTSKLRLPLLSRKILKVKANWFSKLELSFKNPVPRSYFLTLVILLGRKQSQWREKSLYSSFKLLRRSSNI